MCRFTLIRPKNYFTLLLITFTTAACENRTQNSESVTTNPSEVKIIRSLDDGFSETINWIADPSHSSVQFKSRHSAVYDVIGWIKDYSIEVQAQKYDFSDATVEAVFDMRFIQMPNPMMAKSLQKERWFNTAEYPEVHFKSSKIEPYGSDKFKIIGNMTIKDITKEFVLDAKLNGYTRPEVHGMPGFTINGKFSRYDFGLTKNDKIEGGKVHIFDDTIYFTANLRLLVKKEK